MNKTEDIFNKAKNEVQKLWANQNELSDFVKFPENLILKNIKSKKVPITNKLLNWKDAITKLHTSDQSKNNKLALCTMCVGVGQGSAIILEKL